MDSTAVNPDVLNAVSEVHRKRTWCPMALTEVNPGVSNENKDVQPKRKLSGRQPSMMWFNVTWHGS